MSLPALRFGKRKKAVELKVAGREESNCLFCCGLPLRAATMGNHHLAFEVRNLWIL